MDDLARDPGIPVSHHAGEGPDAPGNQISPASTGPDASDQPLDGHAEHPQTDANSRGVQLSGPRQRISCERCKRQKSRCDRQHPSCRRCHLAGAPCEYLDRRRPGFPSGYRQTLEDKIGQLQAEVDALRGKQTPDGRPLVLASPAASESLAACVTEPGASVDSAPRDRATEGSISSTAQSAGPTAAAPATDQPALATSIRTKRIAEQEPPADLVFSLVALFFRHIHPWIPFLDARRVFSEMAVEEDPPLLCYALFGISLPFSHDSRLARVSCDSFWKYTKRRIFVEVLEEPSYASLEALTVLAIDLSGMTNGPQVWGALAIAVKLAAQLKTVDGRVLRTSSGDEEDQDEGVSSRPVAEVHCRRLFWAIYTLDCYVSMTTSQPSQLADCHIAYFVPTRQATWSGGNQETDALATAVTPVSIFSHQLRLMATSRDIHACFLDYIGIDGQDAAQRAHWRQKFAACSDSLDCWLESLPRGLRAIQDRPRLWARSPAVSLLVTKYAYYYALTIHLHSLLASFSPTPPEPAAQLESYQCVSRQKCAHMVEKLVDIVTEAAMDNLDKLGWPFGWAVWVAARYTLIAEHGGESAIPRGHFAALLGCLKALSRYWQVCGKYWWLLRQAWAELLQREGTAAVPKSGVLHFLLDQRAATSDLEDRFRCDPFFNEAGKPPHVSDPRQPRGGAVQNVAGVPAAAAPYGHTAADGNGLLLHDLAFSVPDEVSEVWYSWPLNPSSAFQMQYPELFGDPGWFGGDIHT